MTVRIKTLVHVKMQVYFPPIVIRTVTMATAEPESINLPSRRYAAVKLVRLNSRVEV